MPLAADEWLSQVRTAARKYFPDATLNAQVIRHTRVKARLEIDEARFVDLFFREETGRIDYALIANRQRVFGLDNLGRWHEHPLHSPETHVPVPKPTPDEAFRRLREANDALS